MIELLVMVNYPEVEMIELAVVTSLMWVEILAMAEAIELLEANYRQVYLLEPQLVMVLEN